MGGPAADPEGSCLHPPLLLVHQGTAGLMPRDSPPAPPRPCTAQHRAQPPSSTLQPRPPPPGQLCLTDDGPQTTGGSVDPASSLCHVPASVPARTSAGPPVQVHGSCLVAGRDPDKTAAGPAP